MPANAASLRRLTWVGASSRTTFARDPAPFTRITAFLFRPVRIPRFPCIVVSPLVLPQIRLLIQHAKAHRVVFLAKSLWVFRLIRCQARERAGPQGAPKRGSEPKKFRRS